MFDPYGKVTVLDGNGTPRTVNESLYGNPWTFTGRRLDGETGLMQFRNRMYDVELGRFVSRDKMGYVDGYGLQGAYFVPLDVDPTGLIRDLLASPDKKDSETSTFCTYCDKIVMEATLTHTLSDPLEIVFTATARPSRVNDPKCKCEECGWVQFVEEAEWVFDNATGEGVGKDVPDVTPSNPGGIYYGKDPKEPRRRITDQAGIGMLRVNIGENKGALRKRFVARFVCKKGEKLEHEFNIRFTVYHHEDKKWTKAVFEGATPMKEGEKCD